MKPVTLLNQLDLVIDMEYFYDTHSSVSSFMVEANTDDDAIEKVKQQEGQYLIGVHTIYTKDSDRSTRIIWME